MRTLIDKFLPNPGVLVSLGLVITMFGAMLLMFLPDSTSRLRQVAQLQPLAMASPNQLAFVEGRISNQTPTIRGQFVAYLRESRRRGRGSSWVEFARETPPLVIEAHDRLTRVVNSNYSIEQAYTAVIEQESTFTTPSIQSRGFVVGSPVLAVGSATEGREGLVAEFLYPGTYTEYVAGLHTNLRDGWQGIPLLLGGTGCMILGLWRFRRETIRRSQPVEGITKRNSLQPSSNKKKKRRSKKRITEE